MLISFSRAPQEYRLQAAWGPILAKAESNTLTTKKPPGQEGTSFPVGRRCDYVHLPVHSGGVLALQLENKGEKLSGISLVCSTCDLLPCMTRERNCFTHCEDVEGWGLESDSEPCICNLLG